MTAQDKALAKQLIDLEKRFWQSMVDQDSEAALRLLDDPALMVSAQGAMQFDHATYRKMADQGSMIVKSFELSDVKVVFPTDALAILTYGVEQQTVSRKGGHPKTQKMTDSSTWVRRGDQWRCVMHTEAPSAEGSSGA